MKIYQLEYFSEVFKCQSVSKAAEKLYVSQPTISFALKELEDEFGVKLFTRKGNGIVATVEGCYFYEKTSKILDDVHALRQDMLAQSGKSVHLKVGTPPMIGTLLFPEMYVEMRKQLPKLELGILEYGSLRVRDLVLKNEADIAIAILDSATDDDLEQLTLFSTELVFCVNKNNPLAQKDTIDWVDLDGKDVILMKEDSYQNALVKQRLSENDVKPNIVLYSSQLTTITKFIDSGMAGAFLFKELCDKNKMKALHLVNPVNLNIGAIWRKNSETFLNELKFISFLKKYVAEQLI